MFSGLCWRSKNEVVSNLVLWKPKHGKGALEDRHMHLFICWRQIWGPQGLLAGNNGWQGWLEKETHGGLTEVHLVVVVVVGFHLSISPVQQYTSIAANLTKMWIMQSWSKHHQLLSQKPRQQNPIHHHHHNPLHQLSKACPHTQSSWSSSNNSNSHSSNCSRHSRRQSVPHSQSSSLCCHHLPCWAHLGCKDGTRAGRRRQVVHRC